MPKGGKTQTSKTPDTKTLFPSKTPNFEEDDDGYRIIIYANSLGLAGEFSHVRNGQTLIVKESFPSVTKQKAEDDSVRIESQEAILTKIQLPEAVLMKSIKGAPVVKSDEGQLKQIRYRFTYTLSKAKQLKANKSK